MPSYRYATLLWRDASGFHTATPVEFDDAKAAGYAATASEALDQLKDYLSDYYRHHPFADGPDLRDAVLSSVKVSVRGEYKAGNRVHACDERLNLPVHCVNGRLDSGLLVASLPLLGVRFYYHEPAALAGLVARYAQERLRGLSPRELAAFLPPPKVELVDVVVRVKSKLRVAAETVPYLPMLAAVAEPLGDRAVRKQYSPPWERESLVLEAVRKLASERTNLLCVGESGVGKTSLLAAAVKAAEDAAKDAARRRGDVQATSRLFWLTSAGRLIAGMKYLGQWEARCERVIEELARIDGVLVVDRLLDLVRVGGSGPGDSLAAFFAPYLRCGELRVASECSSAELDACRRLLPGFADLFPLVHVPPFDRDAALSVLRRTTESQARNLRLELHDGVPERVYHLFRRFEPYRAFPGPAVGFVRDLCSIHSRLAKATPLTAEVAVASFTRRTGLPDWLLRDETPLDADKLIADLRARVIGQDDAVAAAAQVVTTFKAGLNDPQRPLGVLLFCGPTGVGKTELARSLAQVLFGASPPVVAGGGSFPLIRLDMSEFAGFDAVDRLLGQPDGEPGDLIRKLRRRPFCVVLFDEIEKAGPEVFDVLLGVLDEGRLTDRYGRVTTFRSSVIVMTSNLGAERGDGFGFRSAPATPFADAAREYFRPEFFNRLDAVVTFQPLGPNTVEAIARKELAEIAVREGLTRVGLTVAWSDALVARLAAAGFDARYGARPLQRVLEREVVAPLARFLLSRSGLHDARLVADDSPNGVQFAIGDELGRR